MRDRRLHIDYGNLYRWLRKLEREGSIQSCWIESELGPKRRSYRLTAKGRRTLKEIAGLVSQMRDTQDAFLQAYEPAQCAQAACAA